MSMLPRATILILLITVAYLSLSALVRQFPQNFSNFRQIIGSALPGQEAATTSSSRWPKVVAQFHSDEDIPGGCRNFATYTDCVNSFLNNPVAGIDGIMLSPRKPDSELKALIDKGHSLGLAVGMWAECGRDYTCGMNEIKRDATLGADFVEEDEMAGRGMTAKMFNNYTNAGKGINPNIIIGITEPSSSTVDIFIGAGGKPDFIAGESYGSGSGLSYYTTKASSLGIRSAFWLDGSGVGGNTLYQSCTVYKTSASVWYFNAAGYFNQILPALSSCYGQTTTSTTTSTSTSTSTSTTSTTTTTTIPTTTSSTTSTSTTSSTTTSTISTTTTTKSTTTTSSTTTTLPTTTTSSTSSTTSPTTTTTLPECKCSWLVCNQNCGDKSGNICLIDSNCFGATTSTTTTSTSTTSTSTTLPTTTTTSTTSTTKPSTTSVTTTTQPSSATSTSTTSIPTQTTTTTTITSPAQPCRTYDISCWIGYFFLRIFGLMK